MTTFSLYWSDWLCEWAVRHDQEGQPMSLLWGGWNQHTRPLKNAKPGDRIIVTSGFKGRIYLLADLVVDEAHETGDWFERHPEDKVRCPHGCAATVVVGRGESIFRLDRIVPPRWLSAWTFVNANGKLRPVANLRDGRLEKTNSFQGCYRIDEDTAARARAVLSGEEADGLWSDDERLRVLERGLLSRPADIEAVQVYADALMEAGDARGEVTAAELELAQAADEDRRRLGRKLNALVSANEDRVMGWPGGYPFRLSWGLRKKLRAP